MKMILCNELVLLTILFKFEIPTYVIHFSENVSSLSYLNKGSTQKKHHKACSKFVLDTF